MENQWKQQTIGIAGCGGLGGNLIEDFLRLGMTHLVVCDGDVFEPSNMDRQILCTQDTLGRKKVNAARERAKMIAPDTTVEAYDVFVDENNGKELFRDCVLIVDALDSLEGRKILRSVCRELQIPLVHGAICDWALEVGVLYPGDLFPMAAAVTRREEQVLSFVPAVCAGLQVAEAVKILRGEESSLKSRIRYVDLKTCDYYDLVLQNEEAQ